MLVSVFVLALAMQTSPTAAPQRAFVDCLTRELIVGLEDKVDPDRFAPAFASKCSDQEAAYRAALIRADRASRISQTDAEESATDEIAYWRKKFIEDYAMHFADHTEPVLR